VSPESIGGFPADLLSCDFCGFSAAEPVARTDGCAAVATDYPAMSYAILWRENGDPVRVGKLVVHFDRLVLEGGDGRVAVRRELAYGGIRSVRIGRERHERLEGRPVAVLDANANTFKIASLAGRGELNEIVGLVEGLLTRGEPAIA
jgi:hypothetical protein